MDHRIELFRYLFRNLFRIRIELWRRDNNRHKQGLTKEKKTNYVSTEINFLRYDDCDDYANPCNAKGARFSIKVAVGMFYRIV